MPLFMAGMWAIALIPVMPWAPGRSRFGIRLQASAAAGSGFLLFMAAERLAPLLPLWEPVGVAEVAGVAVYVLLPEPPCAWPVSSWCAGPERVRWR